MVPCQPRQLVILSLPFAALVAFFWFKRRRSLSRSDPGGTVARQKPADTTIAVVNGKLKTSEKETKKTQKPPVLEGEIISKTIIREECAVVTLRKVSDSVKSFEKDPVVEIKDIVCNGSVGHIKEEKKVENNPSTPDSKTNRIFHSTIIESAKEIKEKVCNGSVKHIGEEKEVENNPSTPDFENNRIFHSTIIESDKDFEESKEDSVLKSQVEKDCSIQNREEEADNLNLTSGAEKTDNKEKAEDFTVPLEDQSTVENILLKKEKSQDKTVPFEDQSTVENICLKKNVAESTIDTLSDKQERGGEYCSSLSDSTETVENVSVDTGLGSQDPSAAEDCSSSMAQGQKTDEKNDNAAGLEQKLASLGLDTSQQPVQRNERDSANHSPAEVMLSSPAISTFSDAHSEGSSDSGKGCSDVVTPPSRTPAGGSSVAGDVAPSVYEFVLPQVIVGRLIGRHGAFLQDIRAKTHTNVFIKKHPETNSLKICAIEGTHQDIDAALKMIRQKFPLRRFPDLTLDKVTFVKNPCMPINPETLQLHLVEGVNNDVILSSLITASHFFLQMPMHITYQSLYKLGCIMNSVYNTQESPPLVEPQPNVVCVAPTHGGWYRAQIMSVDEDANTSEIKFLDYGGYMTLDNSSLRQIRGDFLLLPFQAIECVLANVLPAGGAETWSEEAKQFVQLMTTNQTLQAQVYDYTDTGLPVIYLYSTQFYQSLTDPSGYETKVVLLNQELVSHGYADVIDSSQEDQTEVAESS